MTVVVDDHSSHTDISLAANGSSFQLKVNSAALNYMQDVSNPHQDSHHTWQNILM